MNLSTDRILELFKPSRQTAIFILSTLTVFSIFGLIIFFQSGSGNTGAKAPDPSGDALKYIQQQQNAQSQVQGLNTENLSLFGPEKPTPSPSPSPLPSLTPSPTPNPTSTQTPTNNNQSTPTPTPTPSPSPSPTPIQSGQTASGSASPN